MIEPAILLRMLHSHNVTYVLHNAYRGSVTLTVGAYRADVGVADVVAHAAVLDVLTQSRHSTGKLLYFFFRAAQHVEHKPQGCLATYAR